MQICNKCSRVKKSFKNGNLYKRANGEVYIFIDSPLELFINLRNGFHFKPNGYKSEEFEDTLIDVTDKYCLKEL